MQIKKQLNIETSTGSEDHSEDELNFTDIGDEVLRLKRPRGSRPVLRQRKTVISLVYT